jgi:hypothetical protein
MQRKNNCPFCGFLSTHVLGPRTSPEKSTHAKGYQVECINCGARGPLGMATEKDASLVWDRGDFGYRDRQEVPNARNNQPPGTE